MSSLKIGLQLGYWQAQPPDDIIGAAQRAERLGYDTVYTAEAWGSDAFTPLAYIAAHTEKIRLGTSVVQLSARTPTATAMDAHIGPPFPRPRHFGARSLWATSRRGLVRTAFFQALVQNAGVH